MTVKVMSLDGLHATPRMWLWRDVIPQGEVTVLAGPSVGKSTLLAMILSNLTRGVMGGDFDGMPMNVAIMSEESPSTVIGPRIEAAGGDRSRVYLLPREAILDDFLAELVDALNDNDIQVLVVDPVVPIGSSTSTFGALRELQENSGVSIIVVSPYLPNRVPAVLVLAPNADDGALVLKVERHNYTDEQPNLEVRLVSTTVPLDDGDVADVARAVIVGETDKTLHVVIT